jgi:hypothetical protein
LPQSLWWWLLALAAAGAAALAWLLYLELRNQRHIWHDPCITPAQTREDMRAVLRGFGQVLEGKGITWWLDYGTLLGAWRLGEELPFDHDLDISFLGVHEPKVRECLPALAALGIVLDMERTSIFYRDRKIGDAEPWWNYGGMLCREDPAGRRGVLFRLSRALRDDFPAAWVDPVWRIRFDGRMYPCPARPERLLRRRYLTCRLHLRLAIPGKIRCLPSRAFWREALRIWRFRGAPTIATPPPAHAGKGGA